MKNTKMPAIRFKGFNDDWEQRKLKDFVDKAVDNRGKTPPLDENGTHPLIEVAALGGGHPDYSKIEKYLNDDSFENNLRAYIKEGDILFTTVGSIGLVSLMDSREDAAIAQNIVAFRAKENFIPEYLYALFSNEDNQYKATRIVMGAVQPSIKVSQLVDVEYMLSTKEAEQKKIGTYFSNIDYLITLHQRKLEKIKLMKKSMLGKMFSRDAESIPKIRFDGYTDDWEQRKLGELYQRNTERNENLIGYDKTISVATMSYKDDGNGASESSLSTYKVLRVGDIAFEGHTNKQFRFGRFVVNDIGTGIMSPRFSTLRPLNEMPVNFWKQYIHSESVMRRILVNSTKAGTMMNELVIPEFLNQTIMVPSENEQAVIGQYFSNLDHLITLHQRKLEKLKKVKKSLLEHMFPMEK